MELVGFGRVGCEDGVGYSLSQVTRGTVHILISATEYECCYKMVDRVRPANICFSTFSSFLMRSSSTMNELLNSIHYSNYGLHHQVGLWNYNGAYIATARRRDVISHCQ